MTFRNISRLTLLGVISAALLLAACGEDEEEEPVTIVGSGVAPTSVPAAQPTATVPPAPSTLPIPRERTKPLQYDAPPAMTIDTAKKYTATFVMQKGGEFDVELFAADAPKTVNNFVFLAREGFYDGVTFHRVIADFMAQTGDPTATGSGGPGYRFESELTPDRRHDGAGVLSMANSGGTNTNGSQFFITFRETGFLDGYDSSGARKNCEERGVSCHTVFGKVIDGLDVVMNITIRDPGTATTPGDAINTITIKEE